MDTIRIFRRLVTAELGLLVLYIVYSFFTPELPEAVQAWEESGGIWPLLGNLVDGASTTGYYVILGVLIGLMLLYIIVMLGLLALKGWARPLYLAFTLFGLLATPLLGYSILSPIAALLDTMTYLLNGAIVTMLLFIPAVRERFVTSSAPA